MKGIAGVLFIILLAIVSVSIALIIYFYAFSPTGIPALAENISRSICKIIFDNWLGRILGLAGRC